MITLPKPASSYPGNVNLSIVVPLYNEEDNVFPLYQAIRNAVVLMGRSYELVFVDDGSKDHTPDRLIEIQHDDPAVRVLRFRRNFGQTPAMRAGIQSARGKIIVTMDGDLQNDPTDIHRLVEEIERGHDLVIGWRKDRKDPVFSRTFPSRVANRLIGYITGVTIHDSGCSLKAYRGSMIKQVPLYSEMHRFIPAMSTLQSARIGEVIVKHHPRLRGKSKYGLSRIGKVLLDVLAIKMLISFRHKPLRWFSCLAIPFVILSVVSLSVHAIGLAFGIGTHSMIALTSFILFTYLTIHFFFVGLLAEIIVRSGRRMQTFPKYSVEHVSQT